MKVAIIPAAGKGSRLYELGKNYPKTLLPYDGIPILERIIFKILPVFDEIRVVFSSNTPLVNEYIKNLNERKVKPILVPDEGRQGPARSFMQAVTGEEESLFLHLSDSLLNYSIEDYSGNWVSVMKVSDPSRWCMINKDATLIEKPTKCPSDFYALTGNYSFNNPKILKEIHSKIDHSDEGIEYQFSELLEPYFGYFKVKLKEHKPSDFLDFGTIEQFLKNNKSDECRSFNKIKYTKNSVIKISKSEPNKIINEATWFKYVPKEIQSFIPRIYSINPYESSYEMERLKSIKLRDLFIHIDRDPQTWSPIIGEIKSFLEICRNSKIASSSFWNQLIDKTLLRRPDLNIFVTELSDLVHLCKVDCESTFYHGDLHLNNMFFDFPRGKLMVIDPRGELYGHWLYDLAKLTHSFIGKFDFIDAKLFNNKLTNAKVYSAGTEELERYFAKEMYSKLTKNEVKLVYKITASLFASMQPLHKDYPDKNYYFEEKFHIFDKLAKNI